MLLSRCPNRPSFIKLPDMLCILYVASSSIPHIVKLSLVGTGYTFAPNDIAGSLSSRGHLFIVIIVLAAQPVDKVYEMVLVPGVMPVITPVPLAIVATAVFILLHVPPIDALLNVAEAPLQIDVTPVMVGGSGFIVSNNTAEQPDVKV